MLEMMRSPFKRGPPSLLQGDEYFLPELEATFARLLRGANGDEQQGLPNIYLHITGTLRKGRLRGFADDFGEVISEVDHRGSFTFRRDEERNDFRGRNSASALALASRSSASFPIAFEASFVPVRGERDEPPQRGRPNLNEIANFDKDRFVIDGGVLLNKPIDPALKAVFAQPSERHVRRVLAYVVPDPGEPVEREPDKAEDLPAMTELAWDSLVRLPRVQLVADDLNELRERNARVQQRIQLRELLLAGDRSEGFLELAEGYFDLYRSKAAERSVAEMLSRVAQSVGRRRPVLEGEQDWDRPSLRRALVEARAGWLPRGFPEPGNVGGASGRAWDWGIASLESACLAAIDLFRRAAYLMPFASGDEDPGLEGLMADRDLLLDRNADLRQRRGQLQLVLDRLRLINDLGERYWDWKLSQAKSIADDPERLGAWAHEAYANWLHQPGVHEERRQQQPLNRMQKTLTNLRRLDPSWPEQISELDQSQALTSLRQLGDELAGIVVDAAPLLREIATLSRRIEARRYGIRDDSVGADRSPQQVLLRMIKNLLPADEPDGEKQRIECLRRLLALHVADLLLGDRAELEQPVAFIRISGEAPNDFDPGRKTAAEKLAGIQLGHFGAFSKRSWRANDWMWGRLDGAVRLTLVLVNPSRLRQLGYTAEDAYEELYRISRARRRDGEPLLDRHGKRLLEDDDERFLEELWAQDRERIEDELAFLARPPDPAAADPESLPACARAVARTIQVTIL
jgi:patatin-related protein